VTPGGNARSSERVGGIVLVASCLGQVAFNRFCGVRGGLAAAAKGGRLQKIGDIEVAEKKVIGFQRLFQGGQGRADRRGAESS
jgi:hypothetical protein